MALAITTLLEPYTTLRTEGLAICQEIIKAHGGTIQVSSRVRQGMTAQTFLPTDAKVGGAVTEERA